MILFKNDIPLFFTFQLLFFIAAILLGKWYSGNGLTAWGLPFSRKIFKNIVLGGLLGILLYAIPFCLALALGFEQIILIPTVSAILKSSLPFAIGVLFTSFSEDILTRGLIYSHFKGKMKPLFLVPLSATIYLLNHIYRLSSGFDALLYIFLLGIIFMIPLLNTKNLWMTGAMHWAGNLFFFISHEVIQIQESDTLFSDNYLFSICLLIMIPLLWIITKKFGASAAVNQPTRQI